MLEQQAVLLRPWTVSTEPVATHGVIKHLHHRTRPILTAEDQVPLGFVCRVMSTAPPWWSALFPPPLEVRETEDASLLLTVRRRWGYGRRWYVADAEGRPVGSVRRRSCSNPSLRLQDRLGGVVALW